MLTTRRFDLDLMQAAATPRRAWLLLGLGLTLLAGSLAHADGVQRQRTQVVQELAAAEVARRQQHARAMPPQAPRSAAAQAQARAAAMDAQRIVAHLHRPWLPLLDGLDQTAIRQVRLNQLSVDPRFEQINVELEAASMSDVLAYMQRLAGAPLVRDVRLVSFEWRQAESRRLAARLTAALDVPAAGDTATRSAIRPEPPLPLAAKEPQ